MQCTEPKCPTGNKEWAHPQGTVSQAGARRKWLHLTRISLFFFLFFSHVFVLCCVIVSVFWTRLCLYIPGCSDSLDIPDLRPTRSWVAGVHHDSQHAGNCSIRRRASFNKWRGKLVLYNIWGLSVNKIKCKGRRKKTEKRVDSPSSLVWTLDPQGKENGKEWQHVRMLWSGYTHWCQPPTHIVNTNKCD